MPRFIASLVFSLFLLQTLLGQQADSSKPTWETNLEAQHQQLIQQNGPGTNASLRAELLAMRERDQAARGFHNGQPSKARGELQMAANLAQIDADLTAQLKTIVAAHGWPTIQLVGYDASEAAALVLNHSPDHAWQRQLLSQLSALAKAGKIDGSNLASIIDKELVSEGRPQRYGNFFKFENGEMFMYPVEDPAGLDALRARILLPSMAAYKDLMAQIYHLKASDKLAPLPPPVK